MQRLDPPHRALLWGSTSEFPILVDRLNGPIEFLAESLREEAFDWHVEFLGKDDRQARVNVVLRDR